MILFYSGKKSESPCTLSEVAHKRKTGRGRERRAFSRVPLLRTNAKEMQEDQDGHTNQQLVTDGHAVVPNGPKWPHCGAQSGGIWSPGNPTNSVWTTQTSLIRDPDAKHLFAFMIPRRDPILSGQRSGSEAKESRL